MLNTYDVATDNNKIKLLKNVFQIYNNFHFKLANKQLMAKANIAISNDTINKMTDFITLIDEAIKSLSPDEQEIIELSFIKRIHYSKCNYSTSSFFLKRRKTTLKLYELIFSECKIFELSEMINSLRTN